MSMPGFLSGSKEEDQKASILPFSDGRSNIEIYVVTGFHGFLRIPESFCKECNLFFQAAKKAAEEEGEEVDIAVKSYWTRFLRPLLKGGFHPPVILVNGELLSQGYNVPEPEEIQEKLE